MLSSMYYICSTSIVMHGMALNITVQSYDQWLDFGLMAGAEAVPDVKDLANAIAVAFDEVRALPQPLPIPAAKPGRRAKP